MQVKMPKEKRPECALTIAGFVVVYLEYARQPDAKRHRTVAMVGALLAIIVPIVASWLGSLLPDPPPTPINALAVIRSACVGFPRLLGFVLCVWLAIRIWGVRVGWITWLIVWLGIAVNFVVAASWVILWAYIVTRR